MDQDNQSVLQNGFDGESASLLNTAASWGRILGIVGFIMSALMIAMGVLMRSKPGSLANAGIDDSELPAGTMQMAGTMALVMYVIMGILLGLASKFIYDFGVQTTDALRTGHTAQLKKGLNGLKNFMAFWAIMTIISVLFMLMGVVSLSMLP